VDEITLVSVVWPIHDKVGAACEWIDKIPDLSTLTSGDIPKTTIGSRIYGGRLS
jgi:hypothetical protein